MSQRRPTYVRVPRDLADRARGMGQESWFQALLVASLQEVFRDLGENPAAVALEVRELCGVSLRRRQVKVYLTPDIIQALKQVRDRYALTFSDVVACALGRIFRRLDAGVSVSGPVRSGGDWSLSDLAVFRLEVGSSGEGE